MRRCARCRRMPLPPLPHLAQLRTPVPPTQRVQTVAQGAATSIYAATAPELEGQSGAYLADCKVRRQRWVAGAAAAAVA